MYLLSAPTKNSTVGLKRWPKDSLGPWIASKELIYLLCDRHLLILLFTIIEHCRKMLQTSSLVCDDSLFATWACCLPRGGQCGHKAAKRSLEYINTVLGVDIKDQNVKLSFLCTIRLFSKWTTNQKRRIFSPFCLLDRSAACSQINHIIALTMSNRAVNNPYLPGARPPMGQPNPGRGFPVRGGQQGRRTGRAGCIARGEGQQVPTIRPNRGRGRPRSLIRGGSSLLDRT
jgi:hypothetical protein